MVRRGITAGILVALLTCAGAPRVSATPGWPGALETDAALVVLLEVRFAKGAQIAPDGGVQLDAVLARKVDGLYWLVECASDSGGADGLAEAEARAKTIKDRLIARNVPPSRIVAFGLTEARGPKARVRAFSAPPGRVKIDFTPEVAVLDDAGRHELDFLAASLSGRSDALMIHGFAAHSLGANALPLAITRAQTVRNYLLGRGIPGHLLEITAEAVPLASEAERVEIVPLSRR